MAHAQNETDVLVIGSGPGGAAISMKLAKAGMKVLCLEQGPWINGGQYPHFHDEWEIEKRRSWAYDPNVRRLPEDYPVTGLTTPYMMSNVGGSAVHAALHWPRLKPADFRKGTEHGLEGSIDWPISYEDLEPFYDESDAAFGISGVLGDPSYPARPNAYRYPAPSPGKLGLQVSSAFEKLNWHWWPADNGLVTQPKGNRLGCNECGSCLSGCPRGSLSSPDFSIWPDALAAGAQLRVNSRVERITAENGKATGVVFIDRLTGARHEIRAKIVVMAANGIGTPRLLLLSAQKGHPDGLANSNGLVGKHLMHHTFVFTDVWVDKPTEGYKGSFGAPVYSHEFYHTDTSRGFVNGLGFQTARSFGAATAATGNLTSIPIPWGADHHDIFEKRFGTHFTLGFVGEDLPLLRNQVTLDTDTTDSSGLPAAHVDYEVHDNDRALVDWGKQRLDEVVTATNPVHTISTGLVFPPPGWHLLGTCRMGSSPEDSVLNKYNQTWDVPNLFVVDGSSMTTGGAVNPTATIGAIAMRCGEYISRRFADIVGQRITPSNADAPTM